MISNMFNQLSTDIVALPNLKDKDIKIVFGNANANNTLALELDVFEATLNAMRYSQKNESFLLEAVRNFIRKANFDELNEQLNDEQIDEETYYKELTDNNNKYAITLKKIAHPIDVLIIADLVKKIGTDLKEFSVGDVAEMFSVQENQLISYLDSLRNQLR